MLNFKGKIALVTGASRGIGYALSKTLALQGADVIALGRTQGGLEQLDDDVKNANNPMAGNVTLVPMDLKKREAVNDLAASIAARFGKLDILVGNAAILGPMTPLSHLEVADFMEILSINLIVNHRLIRAFEAPLKQNAGRALFVTSSVASSPRAFWGGYAISKAGLENMVLTWADEMKKSPLKINIYDPGATRTKMRATAFPGEDAMSLKDADAVANNMLPYLHDSCDLHGKVISYHSPIKS